MKTIASIIRKSVRGFVGTSNYSECLDAYGHYFGYDGGPETLDDKCLFDNASESEKVLLLRHLFSDGETRMNWGCGVNVELAKLAAKCGHLVREEAERCLHEGFELEHWIANSLRVAYFGSDIRYENRLVDLIEKRSGDCGDGYDGLFIACWFMDSPRVDVALAERFADWLKNDTLDRGGCSLTDVFRLIGKWERMGCHAGFEGLRELYRDYVKRHGDVSYFKDQGLW